MNAPTFPLRAKHTLDRTTFKTSRLLEFCSRKELVAQTGHETPDWPLVVLKELVDNALDAVEEARVQPRIRVRVTPRTITVADNGPGIPADVVESILDFTSRTSSPEAYVSPSRGAQGNALKTIVAMPFVLDAEQRGEGRIAITSRGVRHKITFRVDPVQQEPVIDHRMTPILVKNGTRVTVEWPPSPWPKLVHSRDQFLQIAASYAALNPHLTLSVTWRDGRDDERQHFEALDPAWPKWGPSDPTSPHWYDCDRLERLVAAYLAHDREHGRSRTVREFISEFRGLSGSAKQKAVLEATGLSRASLEELVDGAEIDHGLVERLLDAMTAESRPVKPQTLGIIGRDHLARRFEDDGCEMETFRYKQARGTTDDGIPYVIEAAFGWRPGALDERVITCGVNWSPALGSPFRAGWGKDSLDDVLTDQRVGRCEQVRLVVHSACVRVELRDRGKSAVALELIGVGRELFAAVRDVTAEWCKQRKREERHASAAAQRRAALIRQQKVSIKEAAWQVIRAAYLKASNNGALPAVARHVMYAARPAVQEIIGIGMADDNKQLSSKYFTQVLLPDYMAEHPDECASWNVVFDARGAFREPHTGETVPLGTLDVRTYLRGLSRGALPDLDAALPEIDLFPTPDPRHRCGAVLFIEKEGFLPLFRAVQLAELYDLAIMSTKGMSVTASRELINRLCSTYDLLFLILRDFDKSGFSIAATLQEDNRRYRFKNRIRVIDLGLRLEDVLEWDLKSETSFGCKTAQAIDTLQRNGATDQEVAFLKKHRAEINAFTSPDLVAWLEGKLEARGVRKVVPDDEALAIAYRRVRIAHEFRAKAQALLDAIKASAAGYEIPANLRATIENLFDDDRSLSWIDAVSDAAGDAL